MNRWRAFVIIICGYILGYIFNSIAGGSEWWYLSGLIVGFVAASLIDFLEARDRQKELNAEMQKFINNWLSEPWKAKTRGDKDHN